MVRCKVATGERIRFWVDTWVGEAPLASQILSLFHCAGDGSVVVRDCFFKNGDQVVWGPMFRRNFDEGEIEDFAALLSVLYSAFIADLSKDKIVRIRRIDDSFSVASFFSVLRGDSSSAIHFDHVWKS